MVNSEPIKKICPHCAFAGPVLSKLVLSRSNLQSGDAQHDKTLNLPRRIGACDVLIGVDET